MPTLPPHWALFQILRNPSSFTKSISLLGFTFLCMSLLFFQCRAARIYQSLNAIIGLIQVITKEPANRKQAEQWLVQAEKNGTTNHLCCEATSSLPFAVLALVTPKNAVALLELARIYEFGMVTTMDLSKAIQYYKMAKQANPRLPEVPNACRGGPSLEVSL